MERNEPLEPESAGFPLESLAFRLREAEMAIGGADWRIEQQLTHSYVLLVVMHGRVSLTVDSDSCRLRQDAVCVCSPGQTFGAEAEGPDEVKICLLRFDAFRETGLAQMPMRRMTGELPCLLQGRISVYSAGRFALLCDAIHSRWQGKDELERFRGQLAFQELLYCILKNRCSPQEDSQTSLEGVKSYMERNYNMNLTIEQLARIADISPKYFVDLFKKRYGTSAIDYLTALRIDRAKRLMAQSDVKLREIARQVGYSDEFYFSRKFKKEVGIAPTVYMKSRRRKIAAYRPSNIGQLLALGMIPYAAPLHPKWTAYYYKTYRADIAVHLSAYRQNQHWESNIEMLRQASPDAVISMDGLDGGEKRKLDQVADVFYVPGTETGWREQLRLAAEFLGESGEAELWIQNYDRKIESARERLKREVKDETFLVVRVSGQEIYAHSNRSMDEVFYHDLQLAPAYGAGRFVYNRRITIGELADFDADHLLVLVCQEAETLKYWDTLRLSMPWQELKAVRNGRMRLIPSDPWLEYSAFAHDRIVDDSLRLLTGNRPK